MECFIFRGSKGIRESAKKRALTPFVDVSIPAVPQARGLGFLLDAYQELVVDQFRINTTIQIQNYNLYEYDAVYNLENGQRVNQMINFSSERFFKTIYEEINNTARESREYRQCIKAVTC